MSDPLGFLDKAGDDWNIAVSIVEQAQSLQMERRRNELKIMIEGIGASVRLT